MLHFWVREALRKIGIFHEYFLNKGGGSGIPKLYVKFWWPLFLALKNLFFWPKVTFLSLNVPRGGGGLGIIPKIYNFFSASLI